MNWVKRLAISVPIALVLAYALDKITTRISCGCDPATMDCTKICAIPLEADVLGTLIWFIIIFPIILICVYILEKIFSAVKNKSKKSAQQ